MSYFDRWLQKSFFSYLPAPLLEELKLRDFFVQASSKEKILSLEDKQNFLLIPYDIAIYESEGEIYATESGFLLVYPWEKIFLQLRERPNLLKLAKLWKDLPELQSMIRDLENLSWSRESIVDFIGQLEGCKKMAGEFLWGSSREYLAYLPNPQALADDHQPPHWIKKSFREPAVKFAVNSLCLFLTEESFQTFKSRYARETESLEDWIDSKAHAKEDSEDDQGLIPNRELFFGAWTKKKKPWRFPWVQQANVMDCGPACLAIISLFFNKKLSTHFWRSQLSTDRSGTSLFDLATTAERNGFISHCLHVDQVDSLEEFLFPFIALRKDHFMVVYKVTDHEVYISDPAIGLKKIPVEEFMQGFEHAGLFLKPKKEFLTLKEPSTPLKHYLQFFEGIQTELFLAFLCGALGVMLSLIPPLIGQLALDKVLKNGDEKFFIYLLFFYFSTTLLASFVSWAEKYYYTFILEKFNFRTTSAFIQKTLSLPYHFFAVRHVGDFTERVWELSHIRSFITNTLFRGILNLVNLSIYAFVLYWIHWKAALIVFIFSPVILLLPFFSSRYLGALLNEIFVRASEQMSLLTDLIKGIVTIKSSGAELPMRYRFERKLMDLVKIQTKFSSLSAFIESLTSTYSQVLQIGVLAVTFYYCLNGELTPGQLISFSLIANKVISPILDLVRQWEQFVESKSVLTRLNEIFLTPSEPLIPENIPLKNEIANETPLSLRGEVEFQNVWFRYGGESSDWVLKDISFKIAAGTKLTIVGPSGSGKSTIALLLSRLYEPTHGKILIDGLDYRQYPLGFLREQLGLIAQDHFLFAGSLSENISINAMQINTENLQLAITSSRIRNLVDRRPAGIEQDVLPSGVGFSGGEKQKISLARLFYRRPRLVILDEATSSLDGLSEKEILSEISTQLHDCTVISIAHRYSTVQVSQWGLVLKEGCLDGFAPLQDLQRQNKTFQELYQLWQPYLDDKDGNS